MSVPRKSASGASVLRAGQTVNIPANAPHEFHNRNAVPDQLLCICAPSGPEEFFRAIGVPVAPRTTPPPPLDAAAQAAFLARVQALDPLYRSEVLLPPEPRGEAVSSSRASSDAGDA